MAKPATLDHDEHRDEVGHEHADQDPAVDRLHGSVDQKEGGERRDAQHDQCIDAGAAVQEQRARFQKAQGHRSGEVGDA
jgi:hypothetical protein